MYAVRRLGCLRTTMVASKLMKRSEPMICKNMFTARYGYRAFADVAPKAAAMEEDGDWQSGWKYLIPGTSFSLIGAAFLYYVVNGQVPRQEDDFSNEKRREQFKITMPDTYGLIERERANDWKDSFYGMLLDVPGVWWIYGEAGVGKSTLLRQFTYELQEEIDNGKIENGEQYVWIRREGASKFRVFYLNFGDTSDWRDYIKDFRDQVLETQAAGKHSLIVIDSIGALFDGVTPVADKDLMAKSPYKVAQETVQLFRFLKLMRDQNAASTVILTSKPMNNVAYLPQIDQATGQSMIEVDIDKIDKLSLQLTDKERDAFLEARVHEDNMKQVRAQIDDATRNIRKLSNKLLSVVLLDSKT